jgi:hypothetical protein
MANRRKGRGPAILGLDPSSLGARIHKLGILRPETKGSDKAVLLPSTIPQLVEVPPNIEAKRIISYFIAVRSYSSNPSLLKDDFKLQLFPGCWQTICRYYFARASWD